MSTKAKHATPDPLSAALKAVRGVESAAATAAVPTEAIDNFPNERSSRSYEIWGDMGRYGEIRGDTDSFTEREEKSLRRGRWWEIWRSGGGDGGRYGAPAWEMVGDMALRRGRWWEIWGEMWGEMEEASLVRAEYDNLGAGGRHCAALSDSS